MPTDPDDPPGGWIVVLPVKRLDVAKSRLTVAPEVRAALALAMAQDVAAAVTGAGLGLLVVTDDPVAAQAIPADRVEPDVPGAGLSAAVRHGVAVAGRHRPDAAVAVLAADLPAVTEADLTAVLSSVDHRSPTWGVAADAAGVGTVLLAGTTGAAMSPTYEGASFAAHRRGGAVDLTPAAGASLRRDVDTVDDLAAAVALGVGPATRASIQAYAGAWRAVGLR